MKKFGMTGTRPQARKANQEATKKRPAPADEAEVEKVDGDDGDDEVVVKDETPVKKEKLNH
jgi:hypothetical protein